MSYFRQFKPLKNTVAMHFLKPCTGSFKLSGATLFLFFIRDLNKTHKEMIPKKIADFIIAVTGNRIECELREVRTCSVLRV